MSPSSVPAAAAHRHRLRDRLPHGPLVVLLGNRGIGKTQLAAGLLADICRSGGTV